jgi:hypothetical protein
MSRGLSRKSDRGSSRVVQLVDTVTASTGLVGITGTRKRTLACREILTARKLVATGAF